RGARAGCGDRRRRGYGRGSGQRRRVDRGQFRLHGDASRHPPSRGLALRGAENRSGACDRAVRDRFAHRREARTRDRPRGKARRANRPRRRRREGARRDRLGRSEGRERREATGPRTRGTTYRRGHRAHDQADRRDPREPRGAGGSARVSRTARPALMTTLLVANRGEIARRVFRTARRMGLHTVAVYSDADAEAPFVGEADTAIRIGPAPARDSYLNVASIVAAARESQATLLHPGYGFLSEQALFADAVAAAGVTFVGPSPAVLRRLGDKGEAKAAAEAAGVPVVPGYRGADQRDEAFARSADAVGYPVLLKPAGGGGGIGIQLVTREADLADALARARRTARAAFGD